MREGSVCETLSNGRRKSVAPNGPWYSNKSLVFLSAFFLHLWVIGYELSDPIDES